MKSKKRKGYVFILSVLVMVVVFAMAVAISKLSKEEIIDVNADSKMDSDYYVAMSGINMIYGALTQPYDKNWKPDSNGESIVNRTGKYRLDEKGTGKREGYTCIPGFDMDRTLANRNELMNTDYEIDDPSSNKNIGTCHITLELYCGREIDRVLKGKKIIINNDENIKVDPSSFWCYKIVCKGYSKTRNSINKNIDGHTVTMFLFVIDPGNPKVYDGVRSLEEAI